MKEDKINRLNELARKQKQEGLNAEEKAEQEELRRIYIRDVKNNLRLQLDYAGVKKKNDD